MMWWGKKNKSFRQQNKRSQYYTLHLPTQRGRGWDWGSTEYLIFWWELCISLDTKFSKRWCWCKGNLLEGTPGWLSFNFLDCPLVVRSHKSIATSCSYLSSGKLQINFSQCRTLLLQMFQIWFYNLISASSIFILPAILYIRWSIFNIMIKYLF